MGLCHKINILEVEFTMNLSVIFWGILKIDQVFLRNVFQKFSHSDILCNCGEMELGKLKCKIKVWFERFLNQVLKIFIDIQIDKSFVQEAISFSNELNCIFKTSFNEIFMSQFFSKFKNRLKIVYFSFKFFKFSWRDFFIQNIKILNMFLQKLWLNLCVI